MDVFQPTQGDLKKLRDSQHKLNSDKSVIGNIIEHPVQNPKDFKQRSKAEQQARGQSKPERAKPFEVEYKPVYYMDFQAEKSVGDMLADEIPISQKEVEANQWLNMDTVEFEKMEWMTSRAEKAYLERLNSSTQFDKDGRVVPKEMLQITKVKSEELTQSLEVKQLEIGQTHDIEALVQMLDSAYDPQVTYALNVIGKIANHANLGYYDGAFDENIYSILIKNCLLRVRHHLDHTNETVCQSAMKSLSALLCNTKIDEVVLDRMFPLHFDNIDPNMWLQTSDMSGKKFTIEMKDIECIEIDAIAALVERTNILARFNYLLQTKETMPGYLIYQECILDILIRMARHSKNLCYRMSKTDLMNILASDRFLPKNPTSGSKHTTSLAFKALKLIRIISQAMVESRIMVRRFPNNIPKSIIGHIQAYFFIDCFQLEAENLESMFKLHIETIRLMIALCRLEEFQPSIIDTLAMAGEKLFSNVKHISALEPLKLTDNKISFDWQYAAHLITLVGFFFQERLGSCGQGRAAKATQSFSGHLWMAYIQQVILTWVNTLVREKLIPHLDVSITLATALRYCDARTEVDVDMFKILTTPADGPQFKWSQLKGVAWIKSLCQAAENHTQLRDFVETKGRNRDTKCLPSYGFLNFNTSVKHSFQLNPTVDSNSPYILLNTMIDKLLVKPIEQLNEIRALVDSIDIVRYIRLASSYGNNSDGFEPRVQESVAAQYEVVTIGKALLLLGRYYLENVEVDSTGDAGNLVEIAETRAESYGNLCHHTIGVIGLLNPRAKMTVELKDTLLQKILFVDKFQEQIFREGHLKRPESDLIRSRQTDWEGKTLSRPTTEDSLRILAPVYLSCDQPDRFWIFQPILDYYNDHHDRVAMQSSGSTSTSTQANSTPTKSTRGKVNETPPKALSPIERGKERWFLDTVDFRHQTSHLTNLTDAQIIEILLSFHWQMMRYSIQYCKLFVKPHLEDALCCIGTIFLDDELFLNEGVAKKIRNNVEFMIKECLTNELRDIKTLKLFSDASRMVKPINMTLGDFFTKLLDQYEAASYADYGFSNYMLLFLNTSADIVFRRKLFQEKETCVRLLARLGGDLCWAPRNLFCNSRETDREMLRLLAISRSYIPKGNFLSAYVNYHLNQ